MQTYYFKCKGSNDKFASRVLKNTLQEAIEHFAIVKQLPIEKFEELYEVKQQIEKP